MPAYTDAHHVFHPAHKYLEPALETPITIVTMLLLVILGWAIARDVGRGLGPALFRRLDPATAGTVGFLIRLATVDHRARSSRSRWPGSKRKRWRSAAPSRR